MKHLYFLLFTVIFSFQIYAQQAPFITTWEVTSGSLDITIPTTGSGYNYTVDFGDGTVQSNVTGNVTYNYNAPGIYTVTISGNFPRIRFGNFIPSSTVPNKIKSVDQWGDIEWTSMESAFRGCSSLIINATDAPDLSQVTTMTSMFNNASSLNQSINHWDVSNIIYMNGMFHGATSFNQPLNNWDLSSATSLGAMFRDASSFNQSLNSWNVSNVINMVFMFKDATSFNQQINNWDVSNVTNMSYMFQGATTFNQSLNNWDVSNVNTMNGMFSIATNFNQSLNSWNVSNVINMEKMFTDAYQFNQTLNNWDVSNVTNMKGMFKQAFAFNQPLNNWNVSNVSDMNSMFYYAKAFNQTLNSWDLTNVTDITYMFSKTENFNQQLNDWNVSNITDMTRIFWRAEAFNQEINTWDVSNVITMREMFSEAYSFNKSINDWDVSNVITMREMFREAYSFNNSINDWDVSNVSNMEGMFMRSSAFNQPLNDWNVSNVNTMALMFYEAATFNQPLNQWDVSNVIDMQGMFDQASNFNQDLSLWIFNPQVELDYEGFMFHSAFINESGLDVSNYDALLTRFAQLGLQNKKLSANGLYYCNSGARDYLINVLGWNITGDDISSECNSITGSILFDQNNNGCDPNDIGVDGFMINANDGNYDFTTFSSNGTYHLPIKGTSFTVSVANAPSHFTISPATTNVTFSGSNTEVLDFCITANQIIEDLNITLLPLNQARPGFEAKYRLVVRNVGTETIANVNATFEFDDTMQQFVSANPTPGSTTTNTLTFSIGSMQPFQTFDVDITMLTFQPPTVNGGDILNFIATVMPIANDFTPNDNTYNLAQIVVNSFGPNDKQVLQGEELHIDDIGEYLDYLIRFQNTGMASAINVRILDTLHPKLDWSTLTPISASHDYYVKITEGNRVAFMFDNINLPDEATNEPDSHGFVAYKIKPKSDVQVGDVISGDASIYFDFNAPIITNMVYTEIVDPLGITDVSNPLNQVVLYPNPTNKTLNIHLNDGIELQEVLIYDLQGKEVETFEGDKKTLDVEHLRPGLYFLKITTDRGVVNRKLVKD